MRKNKQIFGPRILNHVLPKQQKPKSKLVHIHFDANNQKDTQQDNGGQVSQNQKSNRKQDKIQKIQKKQKRDLTNEEQSKMNDNKISEKDSLKNRGNLKNQLNQLKITQQTQKHPKINISQDEQKQSQFALKFLNNILHHKNNQDLINYSQFSIIPSKISNHWILQLQNSQKNSSQSPMKLQSILILYMILYRFDQIQFQFIKSIKQKNNKIYKQIEIKKYIQQNLFKINNNNQHNLLYEQNQKDKFQYKKNQFKKYLTLYIQWLILNNQNKLVSSNFNYNLNQSPQFWVMALNRTEQYSCDLLRNSNMAKRQQNVFKALYLLNAEDKFFRQQIKFSIQYKTFMLMKKQELIGLPKCHWILGINMILKYFTDQTYEIKIKQCLKMEDITKQQIKQFYYEYELLNSYFNYQNNIFNDFVNKEKQTQQKKLYELIYSWILTQSNMQKHSRQQNIQKLFLTQQQSIINLNSKLCHSLLLQSISHQLIPLKQCLITIILILQKQHYLSFNIKQIIFSDILYNKQHIAYQIFSQYNKTIQQFRYEYNKFEQQQKQLYLPKFWQKICQEYFNNYKYRLLSQKYQENNNILLQLKYLVEIQLKFRDINTRDRIYQIILNQNIISYWDKNIQRKLCVMISDYEKKILNIIENNLIVIKQQDNNKNKHKKEQQNSIVKLDVQLLKKQHSQLQVFVIFMKVSLSLDKLTLLKLSKFLELYQKVLKDQTELEIKKKTMNFIRSNILYDLFNNNANNLLLEEIQDKIIKELEQTKYDKKSQKMIQQQNQMMIQEPKKQQKKLSFIQSFEEFAEGYPQFEEEIKLLKFQAKIKSKASK